MGGAEESRLLTLLPYASAAERQPLLFRLGQVEGDRALAVLVPIVDGSVKRTASEREALLQRLERRRAASP
ncbi:hypothetical protein [Nocardioides sp. L-11A]|uniref:hypothetical protein n=1 Tax=Nocardioides sp. L-11A TaxID=3043848 RepID=UPI00249CEA3F|nr:hypothetical protein QJ852_19760 [Nocardioides sp. L-11A]